MIGFWQLRHDEPESRFGDVVTVYKGKELSSMRIYQRLKGRFYLVLMGFFLGIAALQAAADRPKVGLVLAGGGARGAAHIGVLKYLEAHDIPVDIVTGTSMGAIIGGLYATGLSAAEIELLMLEMDWEQALLDDVPRQKRSIQRRVREDQFSIAGTPGYVAGELKIPSGAIQGQNVILALQRLTHRVAHIEDFDALPRQFKAVATDIVSGEMVVLDSGDLALALRASMGIPAIFAPIEIDGRLLVDGGITNNLPVDLAKQMGADIVIAVDITSPMLNREALGNLLTITDQLTRILVVNNTQKQRALLTQSDLLVLPELDEVSAVNFDAAEDAISAGFQAMAEVASQLPEINASEDHQIIDQNPERRLATIQTIALENDSHLSDEVLIAQTNTQIGDSVDLERIENDVNRIHGLGQFELVSYQLKDVENETVLNINARGKSWGANYLHFGFNLESEFKHDSRVAFLLGYSQQAISSYGGEWLSTIHLGDEPAVKTDIFLPLTADGRFFAFGSAVASDQALFDYEADRRTTVYALRKISGALGVGYEHRSKWRSSLGLRRVRGQAVAVSGSDDREDARFSEASLDWRFSFDTRDDIDFPAHGSVVNAVWSYYADALGGDRRYSQWQVHAGRYFERSQHNLGINLHLGATNGAASINSEFRIGGYGLLTGLKAQAQRGGAMGVLSAVYYQRYNTLPILDGLIGGTLEYGGAWADREVVSAETAIASIGAFIGADTPLGTLQLGFAIAEAGRQNYYARIGRVF